MAVRTIKVTNVPLSATAENMKEFFSFSGEIEYVEMRRDSETSQVAYVTFKEFHGADTALLLSGSSMCGDVSVNIAPVEDYELPPEAYSHAGARSPGPGTPTGEAVKKAEEVVSTMLARGFVLSKDALRRAQSFDGRHQQLLSTATARVASLDRRLGLSDKFSLGAVARAASDVGAMTMEKVGRAEEEGEASAAEHGHYASSRVDVHDGQGGGAAQHGDHNKAM
uniref:RRM domain-containing protein n=1 Tax=Zea mays TaxID=4577 RepID=A0A804P1D3_MAIZE